MTESVADNVVMTRDGYEKFKAGIVSLRSGLTEAAVGVPRIIEFIPQLPRTSMGEIVKRKLSKE